LLAVFLHKIMNTEISIQMSSIQIISFENELRNEFIVLTQQHMKLL
jgi:hypothetical protein